MNKPKALKLGDKVAIVSLSSGMLGEGFNAHNLKLGIKRLEQFGLIPVFMPNSLKGIDFLDKNPQARAQDLKDAFQDDEIKGIICAIGGIDTYRLLPYLMEDEEFLENVSKSPKLFTGFSDTTNNHLMFYKLGLQTFYGPNFVCDLGEMAKEMLPYSKETFGRYFKNDSQQEILSSDTWYEERTDFSSAGLEMDRIAHKEVRGYEVLQGTGKITGEILGGCLESLYDILVGDTSQEAKEFSEKYQIFPSLEAWTNKILFIETCEEKPTPEQFEKELQALKDRVVCDVISGMIVGKPQDEAYYEEYKEIISKIITNKEIGILVNVNFGHSNPRCMLPYGITVELDLTNKSLTIIESVFQL